MPADSPYDPEIANEAGAAPQGMGEADAGSAGARLAQDIRDLLERRKTIAAGRIIWLARGVRAAADWLTREAPGVAGAMRRRAYRVEVAALEARHKSFAELEADLGASAAARPYAFLGWGVVAGFLLARRIIGRAR